MRGLDSISTVHAQSDGTARTIDMFRRGKVKDSASRILNVAELDAAGSQLLLYLVRHNSGINEPGDSQCLNRNIV